MDYPFFDAYTWVGPRMRAHGEHPWSLQHLLDEMAHVGIAGALVSSVGQQVYDTWHENQKLSALAAAHERLYPMWNVMPHWTGEMPAPAALAAALQAADVRAVMLHPKTNGWNLRSTTSAPLLAMLAEQRLLTQVRVPDEIDWTELEWLLGTYPELPVHATHMSWSQARQLVPLVRNFPNLHISFTHFQSNRMVEYLVAEGHEDQLLFASNAPEMSAGAHRAYVDWAELPAATRAKIAGGNLRRLLRGQGPTEPRLNPDEDSIMAAARKGEPLPCLTLDMHGHILESGMHGAGGAYTMRHGDPAGVRELAMRMGVDGIGVMSWNGTVGAHAPEGNAAVRAALDFDPEFYWGLATFDVIHETPETMAAQIRQTYADPRFLGLKPYPSYGIRYDDPRYDVWWEYGNAHQLYCGLHPTLWYKRAELASICERFPDLTVVAYHAGASYETADTCIELARRFPNFMAEPTLTPVCGGIIDYLAAGMGADRLMYGSDLPMRDPRQQLGWIVYSRLSEEDKRQVLGANAARLLQRVRTAIPGRPH